MGQALDGGPAGAPQGLQGIFEELLVAKVGNALAFGADVARGCGQLEDLGFEFGHAFAR